MHPNQTWKIAQICWTTSISGYHGFVCDFYEYFCSRSSQFTTWIGHQNLQIIDSNSGIEKRNYPKFTVSSFFSEINSFQFVGIGIYLNSSIDKINRKLFWSCCLWRISYGNHPSKSNISLMCKCAKCSAVWGILQIRKLHDKCNKCFQRLKSKQMWVIIIPFFHKR